MSAFQYLASSLVALRPGSTTSEQSLSKPPFPGKKAGQYRILFISLFILGVFALLKEKTGETGKLVLGVGLAATLFSKELLIVHAEVYL